MKSWARLIIIAILLIVVGLSFVGIGVYKGGKTYIAFDDLFQSRSRTYEQEVSQPLDGDIEPFENLEIDIEAATIRVIEGDSYSIQLPELNRGKVSYEVKNNKLIVTQEKYKKVVFGFWGINIPGTPMDRNSGKVTIYVPKHAKLKTLNLVCGAGEIEMERLEVENMRVTMGAGELKMDEVLAGYCKIEGGVGEVEAKRFVADTLDLSAGVGEINIEGEFKGDVTLNGGIGEIKLKAKGAESDFNYKLEKGLGELRLNRNSVGNLQTNNNADKTITVKSGIGSIQIFVEE